MELDNNNGTVNMTNAGDVTSNNHVVIVNNNGLGYEDVKKICADIIKEELSKYTDEAKSIALERQNKLINSIVEKLKEEQISNEYMLDEFKNPDMQYCYFAAQKAYIRNGTDELESILSRLIVDRAKEANHTLLQIALNEAVEVSNLLLPEQYKILALVFILRYTNFGLSNDDELKTFCNGILSIMQDIPKKHSIYQHIVYSKCASIDVGELPIIKVFGNAYRKLFIKKVSRKDLISIRNNYETILVDKYPELFLKCKEDNEMLYIDFENNKELQKKLDKLNVIESERSQINNLIENKFTMNDSEIKQKILSLVPQFDKIFDGWENSTIKHLSLTSVGIVLAATYIKQNMDAEIDMSIWI